ncbi:3-phosphoshikimate 1-carboxyvinyltransferase [Caldinitratiruptor microaerophilus]|uniref:3-phosphoshikimate 1-carboxyvinyltransferase n=1 Tax=Caldinitratiruptor microaerophilus TaxID=671077 RepID=A0AA35CJU1_9FIRM|nr:3-phosphoshikimate 1-carboxyvinyltransferase [Caldinitratiruptor microaerophilus]BDG60629.1 3-phosphoshikimate 1-carboxyvinyltransferase [Caldinitratiruptor microaerophilus]
MRLTPSGPLRGRLTVPGDKSISHRAVILGAIARGTTEITNFLPGGDCLRTVACMEALGAEVERRSPTHLRVRGRGLDGLREPEDVLDVGNSGTTIRLLTGLLAGQRFFSVLTGDASIRRRPMGRVVRPLTEMGAEIRGRQGGERAPLAVQGRALRPVHYRSPVASAQVKSAVLLAGLTCEGETAVTEPAPSRDHTERMLAGFGARVRRQGLTAAVEGRPDLEGQRVDVPGDISSAAFLLVAAALVPGSEVVIEGVGVNPTRTGILDVLAAMGAAVELQNPREAAGEPVADLYVRSAPGLRGAEIGGELIPRLIDEIPVLAVAACAAEGTTVIRDAAELRVKESDRLAALATELGRLGARVEERPDGLVIHGGGLRGGRAQAHGDHRLAMALGVAGLVAPEGVEVEGAESVDVSFPGFWDVLAGLVR